MQKTKAVEQYAIQSQTMVGAVEEMVGRNSIQQLSLGQVGLAWNDKEP